MNTSKMERLFQGIANTVNDMILQDWDKVLIYAEVGEGFSQVYFYYYPTGSEKPVYSLDIPSIFNIDQHKYTELKRQLYDDFKELWREFKAQGQEPWTSVTFILERSGKFKMDYTYDDLSQLDPVEKQEKWEMKYLGQIM